MAQSSRRAAEDMGEEFFNTVTHAIGLAASLAGLVYLLQAAISTGGALRILGCGTYACTLVLLYASSTLMHYVTSSRLKAQLRVADHICIYLLIAGTYTPFLVTLVQGPVGWTMLGCVWIMALFGISTKFGGEKKLAEQSALPYVGLGWIAVFGAKELMATIPTGGTSLLLAGGISYSVGVLFFVRDNQRYFHAIWHLFVLAGSTCHFAAVLYCV